MLKTLLKCPENYVSHLYLRDKISKSHEIKSYGLKFGHIETALYESGHNIDLTTNRYFVWEYWHCLKTHPARLISTIKFYNKSITQYDVGYYRTNWYEKLENPWARAALFYLLNRYSLAGEFMCPQMSKHNFSLLNLRTLENYAHAAKDLQLSLCRQENILNSIDAVEKGKTILVIGGTPKERTLLKKQPKSATSMNFDVNEFRDYLKYTDKKIISVFKFQNFLIDFFDNKTYISKFGIPTQRPELAEDVIVTNFDL